MKALLIALLLVMSLPAYAADDWFGKDKAVHFSVCAGVSLTLTLVGTGATHSRGAGALLGFLTATTLGAAKEILDRYTGGDPSWRDFTADVVGAAVGAGIGTLFTLTWDVRKHARQVKVSKL